MLNVFQYNVLFIKTTNFIYKIKIKLISDFVNKMFFFVTSNYHKLEGEIITNSLKVKYYVAENILNFLAILVTDLFISMY